MMIDEIQEQIKDYVLSEFELIPIFEFTLKHRVEIVFGEDYQFYCYIDRQLHKRAFSIELNPLQCLINGIKNYNKNDF